MSDDTPRNNLSYDDAMHGVQTGIAFEMDRGGSATEPKHLRVGVNSALIDSAAIVRLLVSKGICTFEEMAESVRLEANRELDRYEDRIQAKYKSKVTLR